MRYIGLLLALTLCLFSKEIYATFDVVADKNANLAFIASGIVKKVYVDIGSSVKKGEILAELSNEDIKASLQMAQIALKYAKRAYERELKVKHLVDEAKFDSVASRYENAKANYMYKKALYEKSFLKAPFDGVIYKKDIEAGDAVNGMMLKNVFAIQSKTKRKLILYFDQKYIDAVQVGDMFVYKIDSSQKELKAPIVKIYPYASYQNRKAKAEVKTENLTPGLFGSGFIHTKEN